VKPTVSTSGVSFVAEITGFFNDIQSFRRPRRTAQQGRLPTGSRLEFSRASATCVCRMPLHF
jgi:hypothetical protein